MNKALTVFAIIGSASAANTLLRDQETSTYFTTFPNYSDTSPTLATTDNTIKYTYDITPTKYGGYQCIRRGAIYAFPQKITYAANAFTLTAAANTALVTFYGADNDGTYLGTAANTDATDTNTSELNHGCQLTVGAVAADGTAVAPQFLSTILVLTNGSNSIMDNRIFYMGNHNNGIKTDFMTAATRSGYTQFTWNNDFLLASTWQKGPNVAGTVVATDYCTVNYVALADETATSAATAGTGFTQDFKCTFQVSAPVDKGAPAFSIVAAQHTAFQLQWAEWEDGVLTAKTDLVDTSNTSPYWLGAVANLSTGAQWPNPIMQYTINGAAQATGDSATTFPYTEYNPQLSGYAGSPGMIKYYPSAGLVDGTSTATASPVGLTSYSTMDFMAVKGQYDNYNSLASTYNTSKDSYNTLKDAYNKQVKAEKERLADFFKAIFEPVTVIPERPCQPTRLAEIYAVDMQYEPTAALSTDDKKANKAVFTFGDSTQSYSASWRMGYLVASSSTTFVAADNVGHVYGLLGQDTAQVTNGTDQKDLRAWQWKKAAATTLHYQMVSVLPYKAMTAMTSGQTIGVTFTVAAWSTTMTSLSRPGQPDATSAPDAAIGANALAASAVAVAAVAASLF